MAHSTTARLRHQIFRLNQGEQADLDFGALPFFGASIPGFVGLLTGRGPFSPALALITGRSDFGLGEILPPEDLALILTEEGATWKTQYFPNEQVL